MYHKSQSIFKIRLPPAAPSHSENSMISTGTPITPVRQKAKKTAKKVSFTPTTHTTPATTIEPTSTPPKHADSPSSTIKLAPILPCHNPNGSLKSETSTPLPSAFFSSLPTSQLYNDFPFAPFVQSILLSEKLIIAHYPFDSDPLATIEQTINWRYEETVVGYIIRMMETCPVLSVGNRLQVIFLCAYASKALLIYLACALSIVKDSMDHLFWFERFIDVVEGHLREGMSEFEQFSMDELKELEDAFEEKFPNGYGIELMDLKETDVLSGGRISDIESDDEFWA
jgi:hypothetical protein